MPIVQQRIILALARYKYLTRKQLGRLGADTSNSNINDDCKDLEIGKQIGVVDTPTFGFIHFLLPRGAANATRYDRDIPSVHHLKSVPKRKKLESYWMHRIYTVSYQIELDLSAKKEGLTTSFYVRDFDALSDDDKDAGLRRATRVVFNGMNLEPDLIFGIKNRLFVLETENETDSDRSVKKMKKHCTALDERLFGKRNNRVSKDGKTLLHRCLFVFTHEADMKATMARANKELDPKYVQGKWFLFKTQDEIVPQINARFKVSDEKDFFENWKTLSGDRVNMLS